MKRNVTAVLRFFAVGVLAIVLSQGIALAQKNPKDEFEFPSLHEIKMPNVQKAVLKNGMKLFLVEDHDYPTVDLRAMVGVSSVSESPDKIGLADITGEVLRTGGTEKMTGDQIDELLESLGASIETSIDEQSGYVSVSVLKEDIDKGIELLADILMHPAFRAEKIDLSKISQRSMISRRNDEVMGIANREFGCLIYGKENPYARYPEYATIDAVTKDDIVNFYKKNFHPNNIIFAAWGDFKAEEMKAKLDKAFAAWPQQRIEAQPKPKLDYAYRKTVNYVDKPDINQSNIMMGHIGGLMNNPDYPALIVMNQILSFDRMFKTLRTKEGLTYAPWGNYGAEYDHQGIFSCGTQTKSETTVRAVRLMIGEVKRITEEPVTDEELKRAKDTYLNSYAFNFDSKAKIVRRMMLYEYFGYPLDFIQKVKTGVEKVTKDDVLRVAKKYLRPDSLQILVVGNEKDFGEPLSALGTVNKIDITIPEPKAKAEAAPKATKETMAAGTGLLEKAIKAYGGKEKLAGIKNRTARFKLTQSTPGGDMTFEGKAFYVEPDKFKMSLETPMGPVNMVVAGGEGWAEQGGKVFPLPSQQKDEMVKDLKRDLLSMLAHPAEYKIQQAGETEFEGKPCYDLVATRDDVTFHFYLDKASFLVLGSTFQGITAEGPAEMKEVYSNYKDVNGINMPFHSATFAHDKKQGEVEILEVLLNTEIPADAFTKPAQQ